MGRDKALLELDGEPLVLRAARLLGQVADPVLLAGGTIGRLGWTGLTEVEDEVAGAGPLGGLVAGLRACPHDLLAVVGVDMPFLEPRLVAALARLHDGDEAVVPRTARGLEPLHAVYARTAAAPLGAALQAGRRSLREALAALRVRTVPEAEWHPFDPSGRFAWNLNTPQDLHLLRHGRAGSTTAPGRRRG